MIQFCVFLDSDDEIAPNYLQIMSDTILRHNANVVLPIMVSKDMDNKVETGRMGKPYMVDKDMLDGEQACLLTLPKWSVCSGGMAFERSLYHHVLEENPFNYTYSDEFSERLILFYAPRVAFSDAEYIYWQNGASITHKKSVKLYEILCVDRQLLDFASAHYDATVTAAVFRSMLSHLIGLQKDAIKDESLYSTGHGCCGKGGAG